MHVIKVRDRIKNDYWADLQCPYCQHIEHNQGGLYADANFAYRVLPGNFYCSKCGKNEHGNTSDEQQAIFEAERVATLATPSVLP